MGRLKDGDHPDNIVITYGRCNAALELAEDLTRVLTPDEWSALSLRMLDRDVLADDEWWWALHRRRARALGRPEPRDLPSYSTRVTAGHMLAAIALGRDLRTERTAETSAAIAATGAQLTPWDYGEAQRAAWKRSRGRCEAYGLHHRDCPGYARTPEDEARFVTHHVYPLEAAKRDKVDRALADHPSNLLVVYNGHTGLGAGGCHGRIHRERTSARRLGLLARSLPGAPVG